MIYSKHVWCVYVFAQYKKEVMTFAIIILFIKMMKPHQIIVQLLLLHWLVPQPF